MPGRRLKLILGPPSWAIHVDLVEPKVQGLLELGIPVIPRVRCLGLADQATQKLHACTVPAAAGRARDLLDILLIDMGNSTIRRPLMRRAASSSNARLTHSRLSSQCPRSGALS